jgi:hypothetical protein
MTPKVAKTLIILFWLNRVIARNELIAAVKRLHALGYWLA